MGAAHVVSLVDLLITMSLAGQPDRNRQSDHATYTVPAESISADGSEPERSPPASVWCCTAETRTVDRQLAPPSMERNDRIWPPLWIGTITVPLGRTTGWPPSPDRLSPVARAGPQVAPPSAEVCIRMALPLLVTSYSV